MIRESSASYLGPAVMHRKVRGRFRPRRDPAAGTGGFRE
jgi:hypothetical protein